MARRELVCGLPSRDEHAFDLAIMESGFTAALVYVGSTNRCTVYALTELDLYTRLFVRVLEGESSKDNIVSRMRLPRVSRSIKHLSPFASAYQNLYVLYSSLDR